MEAKRSAWYAFVLRLVRNGFFRLVTGGISAAGEENLPKIGPAILAPNHVSHLDPPAVACGTNRRQFKFMAKEELFKGIFGKLLKSLGAYPIRRGEGDTESIRKTVGYLEEGCAIVVFPEGTRGDGIHLGPISRGVAMLAKRTGAPVIPVGVIGTHIVLPRGQKRLKRHRILIAYGEPFKYQEVATAATEKENRELFSNELERRIIAVCEANGLPLKNAASDSHQTEHPGPEPTTEPQTRS